MGKRMITYLLVLGAVGYLFLMYIYPALSGLLIFVLLYPASDKKTVYGFLKSRQTIHLNQTGAESGS